MFYLDVHYTDLEDARDVIAANLTVVPYAAYRHPSDVQYHRMEFKNEENRDQVKASLDRFDIENFLHSA